jgi:gluconate kinase
VLHARLEGRHDHYMKAGMLDSQLATLEKPAYGLRIDIDNTPENQVAEIVEKLAIEAV